MRLALVAAIACAIPLCTFAQTAAVPQQVTLIAEPQASAPALYPGKPGIPLEGQVRFVALAAFKSASGKAIDPTTLNYTWTVDGSTVLASSGVGKAALIVAAPLEYRARTVSVRAENSDGTLSGNASVTFSPVEPVLRIYENDPLLGIRFERALSGALSIANTEESLYAAPFSFSTSASAPALQWFLDGTLAQTGNLITMRPQGTGTDSASVSVVASGADSIRATQALSVSFGSKSSNLFGL